MPGRRRSRAGDDGGEPPQVTQGGPGEGDDRPPPPESSSPRRNPDADPVRVHREYVQRRLGGGALPTPEAYERAVDQWHRLSGAVRTPATEVRAPEAAPPAAPTAEERVEQPEQPEERPAAEADQQAAAAPEDYAGPLPATDPGDRRTYRRRGR